MGTERYRGFDAVPHFSRMCRDRRRNVCVKERKQTALNRAGFWLLAPAYLGDISDYYEKTMRLLFAVVPSLGLALSYFAMSRFRFPQVSNPDAMSAIRQRFPHRTLFPENRKGKCFADWHFLTVGSFFAGMIGILP